MLDTVYGPCVVCSVYVQCVCVCVCVCVQCVRDMVSAEPQAGNTVNSQ